jgi:putative transposase
VHGIDGDNSASEAEFGEQCLHRRDFIRLLVTVEMRQHQRGVAGERVQDMRGLAVLEMVEAVTQCLAVEGNVAFARGAGLRVQDGGKTSSTFVERLWRSVKYEEVYLRAYDSVSEARASIGRYLDFYNGRRPHASLDGITPDQAYFMPLPLRLAA